MEGGLDTLARDPKFVSATKREMSDTLLVDIDDMEAAAMALLNGRRGRVTQRKKRPIPTPPGPALAPPPTQLPGASSRP